MTSRRILGAAAISLLAALSLSACAPAPTPVAVPEPSAEQSAVASPTPRSAPTMSTETPNPIETAGDVAESVPPAEPTPTATPSDSAEPSSTPSPTPTVTLPPAIHKRGDKGEPIRDLQHRLLQLQWIEGPVTENYGALTQAAVEGFQAKRGLQVTGQVDEATLKALHEMTRKPTHDEMFNILQPGPTLLKAGDKSDAVRDLQARLRQIGWYGAKIDGEYAAKTVEGIKGFQEKRGIPVTGEVDQRTLDKLHSMTRKPTKDELNNIFPKPDTKKAVSMRIDERCMTGRAICISKKDRKLAWVVDGKVEMTMDVRFGATKTPTREGAFSVGWKSRDHVSKLYDSKMPYALFFSGGQAIHFSSDFAARGYRGASHGCVNVRDKAKVAKLFDLAKVGDKVIVYAD